MGKHAQQSILPAIGLLANRPDATTVPSGYIYVATDDNGGKIWVSDGTAWNTASPSVNSGSSLLSLAEPTSIATITATATDTDYRVPELTISFVMPDRPVRVDQTEIRVSQLGTNTSPRLSIYYTTNAWSSSSVLNSRTAPYAEDSVFYIRAFTPRHMFLPTSITPGTNVQVAVFIAETSTAGRVFTITASHASNPSTTLRPSLSAVALGE